MYQTNQSDTMIYLEDVTRTLNNDLINIYPKGSVNHLIALFRNTYTEKMKWFVWSSVDIAN